MEVRSSLLAALVALFGALHAVLVAIPGIWRSWMIVILPIEGVLLGPKAGFLAALMGCLIGRLIRPRPGFYVIFGLAEPVGALAAGLAFRKKRGAVLALFSALLAAYFAHPLGRELPAWCLWDIYVALGLVLPACLVSGRVTGRGELRGPDLPLAVALSAFVGLEADVLTRIFMLIPMCLYLLLVPEPVLETLTGWWVLGAFATPLEALIGMAVSAWIGPPILIALEDKGIKCPMA